MIKPPSVASDYSLIWSGDSALDLPDDEAERERILRNARLTGTWPLKPSAEPTVFHLRVLSGSTFDWWAGEVARRQLVGSEMAALALRLALRRIDNFGGHEVKHEKADGRPLVKVETIDALYGADPDDPEVGRSIVSELGSLVIERATKKLGPL